MEENKKNGKAIASLVLGIVSVVMIFLGLGWISLFTSIVGLILGISAKKEQTSGMAIAGVALNIIGLVISVFIFMACIAMIGTMGSAMSSIVDSMGQTMNIINSTGI